MYVLALINTKEAELQNNIGLDKMFTCSVYAVPSGLHRQYGVGGGGGSSRGAHIRQSKAPGEATSVPCYCLSVQFLASRRHLRFSLISQIVL